MDAPEQSYLLQQDHGIDTIQRQPFGVPPNQRFNTQVAFEPVITQAGPVSVPR